MVGNVLQDAMTAEQPKKRKRAAVAEAAEVGAGICSIRRNASMRRTALMHPRTLELSPSIFSVDRPVQRLLQRTIHYTLQDEPAAAAEPKKAKKDKKKKKGLASEGELHGVLGKLVSGLMQS